MVLNSYYNKSFYDWWGLTPPAWGTGLCLLAGFRLAGFRLPVKTMEKDKGVALQASCHGPARGLSQDLNPDMISRNGRKCSKEKKFQQEISIWCSFSTLQDRMNFTETSWWEPCGMGFPSREPAAGRAQPLKPLAVWPDRELARKLDTSSHLKIGPV